MVLVHGFSVPYYIWDPTFGPRPAQACALGYDLYGRGYSDRAHTACAADPFVRQLHGLLSAMGLEPPVDLVGLSMGGAIAVCFAERHPAFARRLCLSGPGGLLAKQPWPAALIKPSLPRELILNWAGEPFLVSSLKGDFPDPARISECVEKCRPQMHYVGFKRALLSTIPGSFVSGATEAYTAVGRQGRPVLLLWGRDGHTVPFALNDAVRQLIPQADFPSRALVTWRSTSGQRR